MVSTKRRDGAISIIVLSILLIGLVLTVGSDQGGFNGITVKTPEDLSAFLTSMGYECNISTMTVQSAVLPEQFDDTFIAYNSIQLQQNCDLTQYAGKEVTVYTLDILNYPTETEAVLATVIVYKNRVIGGDIHAAAMDGFMVPLKP